MKTEYYWTFRIESSRYYGEKDHDSLGFITEENREAWQRFIQNKINELMKAETMESPEFKESWRMFKKRGGNERNTIGGRRN